MNGILIVDKPAGMTSHDVVSRVRRIAREQSVGHLGTLDPMARGVLPMLLGKYTRLARYFKSDVKAYTGAIRFGFATDTYDAEGVRVGAEASELPSAGEVIRAAEQFRGGVEQTPPPFSAKKIEGTPAYKLARAGKQVEMRPVRIQIHRFAITGYEAGVAEFEIEVSSGGYVRSVAHDLGRAVGCGAHLASLRRTRAGEFAIEGAVSPERLAELQARGELGSVFVSPRCVLWEMPCVTADEETAGRMRNGMMVNLPEYSQAPEVKIFRDQSALIGIGRRVAGTLFQPSVVLGC